MLAIPSALQTKFEEHLRNKTIQNSLHGVYKKWLQYYLDFCRKYHFPPIHKESLPHFILKLQEKKQTTMQQEQPASQPTGFSWLCLAHQELAFRCQIYKKRD